MKHLLALLALVGCCSCQSMYDGDNYRALELHGGVGQLEDTSALEDDDPVLAIGARALVQPNNPALISDASGPNRPIGLVGFAGLNVAQTGGRAAGQSFDRQYGGVEFGVRYYLETWVDWFQPYVDGAFAVRRHVSNTSGADDYESTSGFVGRLGAEFPFGSRGRIGVGFQFSGKHETDDDIDFDDNLVYGTFTWVF